MVRKKPQRTTAYLLNFVRLGWGLFIALAMLHKLGLQLYSII